MTFLWDGQAWYAEMKPQSTALATWRAWYHEYVRQRRLLGGAVNRMRNFHLSQALMRKFQAIGLQQTYRSDEEACRFLRRTAALAFVPVRFVRLAWQGIKASKPTHLPRIDEFVDYFQSTWITGVFTLQHWNVYENDTYRTNNHVEGWHYRLKRAVGKLHPNIYEFIEVIQREQAATEISILQLDAGARPPRRGIRAIARDRKIKELKDRFAQNNVSLADHVRGLSAHTNL